MIIKIKEIDYGISSRIGSVVYLHKGLREYPELRAALIQHELQHSSGYTLKDLIDDFGINQLEGNKKRYYSFILNNPSSLTEYLPLCKYNKKWVFSPSIFMIWIFAIIVGTFVINNIW